MNGLADLQAKENAVPPISEEESTELHRLASAAYQKAYAPYSKFAVGAAVLTPRGKMYSGCNVENAAYPEGLCAEAGALAAMVLGGETCVRAIVIVGEGLVTPCGGCRQKLREFCLPENPAGRAAGPGLTILVGNPTRICARFSLAELLPESFGPGHLNPEDNRA